MVKKKRYVPKMFLQGLTVQTYSVRSDKLTAPIRIAAVADLHGTVYGRKQTELLGLIDAYAPDLSLIHI